MELKDSYAGVIENWKLDLIEARARCLGFRKDELPDIMQELVREILAFNYDPQHKNKATEHTVLTSLVDNCLHKMRTKQAIENKYVKARARLSCEAYDQQIELSSEISIVLSHLLPREKIVCSDIMAGYSQAEIAQMYKIGTGTVNRIVSKLRAHFIQIGLDKWLEVK